MEVCYAKTPKNRNLQEPCRLAKPADATGDSIAAAGHLVAGAEQPNRRRKQQASCEKARLEGVMRGTASWPSEVSEFSPRFAWLPIASVPKAASVRRCTRACTHQLANLNCACRSMSSPAPCEFEWANCQNFGRMRPLAGRSAAKPSRRDHRRTLRSQLQQIFGAAISTPSEAALH